MTTAVGLVVSGFLGSGKTTLVRALLEAGRRDGVVTAVVSNELGEIGVDRALLAGSATLIAGTEIVELEGGCVCCRLGDQLVTTLAELRDRVRPRRVIVETSGVGLPYDTLLHFWREPVRDWFEDDASLVVVNAEQVLEGRDLTGTFEDQVASADLLVVNKLDLVDPALAPRVDAVLREIERDAPILHTSHGRVDPRVLFPPDSRAAREARRSAPAAASPHSHEQFRSDVIETGDGVDERRLAETLRAHDAVRIKGFVRTTRGVCVVQGVGRRITIEPVASAADPALVGRVVVIRKA